MLEQCLQITDHISHYASCSGENLTNGIITQVMTTIADFHPRSVQPVISQGQTKSTRHLESQMRHEKDIPFARSKHFSDMSATTWDGIDIPEKTEGRWIVLYLRPPIGDHDLDSCLNDPRRLHWRK